MNCLQWTLVATTIISLSGCTQRTHPDFIGSAVIEAQTYQIGTTVQGQITAVYAEEGATVAQGQALSQIDTIPFRLALDELIATASELQDQIAASYAQLEAAKSDARGAKRELDRIKALVDKGSAPSQQKDQLETQNESATFRLKAATASLGALSSKRKTLEIKQAQVRDQIRRCSIIAPVSGTILTRFRTLGELAAPSAPLFELASYDTVWADFFVPQPLLSSVSPGLTVRIRVDFADSAGTETFVPAVVAWVSDNAEFSPKNIQTRESRNELVFRVRARAVNPDRTLKRGLPVEIWR